jgi:hypothetical protein
LTRARAAVAAFLLYGALTAAVLWPMVRDPGHTFIRNDDVYGNAWAMAWVVHQAVRSPLHLFDANSFHPRPSSFAYTEPLLPIALQGAPLLLAGGSPVLAHNLVLLLSFPLAGLAMFLLVRDRTGSAVAALLAGLAWAFSAYRFQHLVHVQSLATQWLPLAVLFLLRALDTGRGRDAALAALFALLQVLSSGYYAVMTALGLVTVLVLEAPRAHRAGHLRPAIVALAVSALVALLVFLPYGLVVSRQAAELGRAILKGPGEAAHWSASLATYVRPSDELYPTAIVAALALMALAHPLPRPHGAPGGRAGPGRDRVLARPQPRGQRVRVAVRPRAPRPWALDPAHARPPGRPRVVRAGPARGRGRGGAGAGRPLGAGGARGGRRPSRRRAPSRRPAALVPAASPIPASARWLASAPRGVVLELPWDEDHLGDGGRYLYWSTAHWQPMVNGWGGFFPVAATALGVTGRHFPLGPTVREMRAAGVRYVVVHLPAVRPQQQAMLTFRRAVASGPRPRRRLRQRPRVRDRSGRAAAEALSATGRPTPGRPSRIA